MDAGLNALQCASPSLLLDEAIHVTLTSDPDLTVTVNYYSLLPLSASGHSDPKKFSTNVVHINTDDHTTPQQAQRLCNVLHEFLSLWEDRVSRISQPEEEWMEIPIKNDTVFFNKAVYRVSKRNQTVIDGYFDQAVTDGHMSMADKITSCGWPVFMVWHNGKVCPIVDLRSLNEMIVLDSYPPLCQNEIISSIYSCSFISAFDVIKTFGQMSVTTKDCWKTMAKT